MECRPAGSTERSALQAFLGERHSLRVARLGQLVRPLDHPALLAWDRGRLAGVLTYILDGRQCEVLTLHATQPWAGAGTALHLAATHQQFPRARGVATTA